MKLYGEGLFKEKTVKTQPVWGFICPPVLQCFKTGYEQPHYLNKLLANDLYLLDSRFGLNVLQYLSKDFSSPSSGQEGLDPLMMEQCELFHHSKDSMGGTERKGGSSFLAPASCLHLPSFWDRAGSS